MFTLICYKATHVDDCNSSLSRFHGVACAHNLLASLVGGLGGVNVKESVPKLVIDRALSQGWSTPFLWIDFSSPSPNLDVKITYLSSSDSPNLIIDPEEWGTQSKASSEHSLTLVHQTFHMSFSSTYVWLQALHLALLC